MQAAAGSRRAMFAGAIMGIYDREYYRGETHGSGWLNGLRAGDQGDHPHQRDRLLPPAEPWNRTLRAGTSSPAATESSAMGTSGNS